VVLQADQVIQALGEAAILFVDWGCCGQEVRFSMWTSRNLVASFNGCKGSHVYLHQVIESKRLVGKRGFEPPTPWSRTRFNRLAKSIESCRRQAIGVEGFAATALLLVDLC
jgi:hypothetical protein